jgi:ribonuclease HI
MPARRRPSVFAAEEPFGTVTEPVQGLMVQIRGNPIFHRSEYAIEIDTDASYDYDSGIRAIAWELREWGDFRAKRAYADRNGQGPNHAELSAAIEGLRAGLMYSDAPIHIRTDNKLTAGIISGLWTARQRHIEQLSDQLQPILAAHQFIALTWVRTRDIRKVDSEAREFRDRLRDSKAPWLDGCKYDGRRAASVVWRLHHETRRLHHRARPRSRLG